MVLRKEEDWPDNSFEEKDKVSVPNHALYNGEMNKTMQKNIQSVKKKVMPIIYPTGLTPVQERLLEFVEKQLALGKSMSEIERIMEYYPNEGLYSLDDVSKVINYVLASRFNRFKIEKGVPEQEVVTTSKEQKNRKVYKGKKPLKTSEKLLKDTTEQKRFIAFLQANPDHNLSSVDVYKNIGLSARKGTRVKDELLKLGKIKVIEERSKKGWKKIIKLA